MCNAWKIFGTLLHPKVSLKSRDHLENEHLFEKLRRPIVMV